MKTFPSLQLLPSRSSSALVLDLPVDRTREAVDLFLANQNSPGTRSVYGSFLYLVSPFTEKRLDQLQSSDLLTYKNSLQGPKVSETSHETFSEPSQLKPATISRKLTTLRAFFRFCLAEGIIDRDPSASVKLPRIPDPRPKALSLSELRKLFSVIDRTTPGGLRDYAMFRLMVSGGLRRAEVRDLDHADLEPKDGFLRVHVRNGKGGKSRHVDVDLSVYDAVQSYTKALGIEDPTGPVFLSEVRGFCKSPGRISLSSINARLKVYSEASGVPCTVHSLRHSYATMAEQGGAHLKDLQDSLGHSSLATTQKYIRRLNDQRNPVMDFVPTF